MTTEQMHVIAKITDARTFERQLEQTVEEAAEFIQAAQKIKRYPGNSKAKSVKGLRKNIRKRKIRFMNR